MSPIAAASNKRIHSRIAEESSHGRACNIWTLSPADAQFERFLYEITSLMPQVEETKRRCVQQGPNQLSIVTWIEIGETAILLGADLEETAAAGTGWSVIVGSAERPQGAASIFKVPHHGSMNAHCPAVWDEMLTQQPFAILTPWNRGAKLPAPRDVDRICDLTKDAYSTAILEPSRVRRPRSRVIEKTLRETNMKIRKAEASTGRLTLRDGGRDAPNDWKIELAHGACPLSNICTV